MTRNQGKAAYAQSKRIIKGWLLQIGIILASFLALTLALELSGEASTHDDMLFFLGAVAGSTVNLVLASVIAVFRAVYHAVREDWCTHTGDIHHETE